MAPNSANPMKVIRQIHQSTTIARSAATRGILFYDNTRNTRQFYSHSPSHVKQIFTITAVIVEPLWIPSPLLFDGRMQPYFPHPAWLLFNYHCGNRCGGFHGGWDLRWGSERPTGNCVMTMLRPSETRWQPHGNHRRPCNDHAATSCRSCGDHFLARSASSHVKKINNIMLRTYYVCNPGSCSCRWQRAVCR